MFRWLSVMTLLAVATPAAAQTFLACRFENGPRLRLALEGQGLALQLPGQQLWQDATEVASLRDPILAGFTLPLPPEAGGRLPPHDRFTLSLDRVSGEARLALSRLPPAAQVAACRAAIPVAPPRAEATAEPPSPPPPCDLPQLVATVQGSCEALRTRF